MFGDILGTMLGKVLGNIFGTVLGNVLRIFWGLYLGNFGKYFMNCSGEGFDNFLRTVLGTVLTCLGRMSLGAHADAAVRQFACVNIHMWRRVRDFSCSNKFAISTR